jgi:hypothetical protein
MQVSRKVMIAALAVFESVEELRQRLDEPPWADNP